ncbi:MAG TPA: ABC transporter substrate-binding protein, partial [Puia sp.]|nr:ABC transporter substrate-binding protein [Puia sp.]
MKKIFQNILILVLFVVPVFVQAQTDSLLSNYHIAVFAPLYLDSAFDESGNYRYDKDFPKFLNTGLEFFEGVQLAVDSLQKEGARLEVHVYDTKSAKKTVQQVLNDYEFQNINLIIGYVSPPELRQLAGAALRRNIPFINANFPNDENIRNNKAMVILNATLKTHCEGIYQFLQKNYRTQTIYVIAKDGVLENRLKNYFSDIEKNSRPALLKLKFVTL